MAFDAVTYSEVKKLALKTGDIGVGIDRKDTIPLIGEVINRDDASMYIKK